VSNKKEPKVDLEALERAVRRVLDYGPKKKANAEKVKDGY
jgi:hypothetical protein